MKYLLLCDDNFHYMDEDERSVVGAFDNREDALAAARRMVDRYLHEAYKPGMTAEELYDSYKSFGSDPFIRSSDPGCQFSAWTYAKTRCEAMCRDGR